MKYLIASDIHGSATAAEALLQRMHEHGAERLILLGDLLYHGPRNPLPEGHNPKEVARLLNSIAGKIIAVRGNCDAEVDQMVLDFPCMADYVIVQDGETQLFCTHGHLAGMSPTDATRVPAGAVLLSGHTHVKGVGEIDGHLCVNPGSPSLPKDGTASYATYENGEFKLHGL